MEAPLIAPQKKTDLDLKKELLQKEIIDKNYNKQMFLDFCSSRKQFGDDLNLWSINELKEVINIYTTYHKNEAFDNYNRQIQSLSNQSPNNNMINLNQCISSVPGQEKLVESGVINDPQNFNIINNNENNEYKMYNKPNNPQQYQNNLVTPLNNINIDISKINQINLNAQFQDNNYNNNYNFNNNFIYNKNNNNNNKNIKKEIQKRELDCKTMAKSILNDKEVIITLENPKAVETSILESNYVIYEVSTNVTGWKVLRRYNDFDWLRNILQKLYPGLYVPPLPPKKMGSRRFENDFIDKRMYFLNNFINDVVKSELFKASEAVISFLSANDRTVFDYKKKQLNSMPAPQRLDEIYSLNGKIKLLEDDFNEGYYTNIKNFFMLQTQLLNRLNYNLKNFYCNLSTACNNLEEVQNDLETLTNLNERVLMKEEILKTFEELSIFFKNWKRVLFNQNELIKKYVQRFFKYTTMENQSFLELIEKRVEKREIYTKEFSDLLNKKEKLWAGMDISKWELPQFEYIDQALLVRDKIYAFSKMCSTETSKVNYLYNDLCFTNYNNNDQLKKLIKINRKRFLKNIKDFSNDFYVTLNDLLNTWTEVAKFASD